MSVTSDVATGIHAHPGVVRVRAALLRHGIDDSIIVMPEATHTAHAAAEALGCRIDEIAKSIIFRAGERAVLVITSGRNRVDDTKVAALLGETLSKADADFVRTQTGFVIGGVAPFAHTFPPIVFMDEALLEFERVWPAAGHPNTMFHISPRRLAEVTCALIADVALVKRASAALPTHLTPTENVVHTHEKLIRDFYAAFAKRDAAGMAVCYHPDISFSDPAFLMLRGKEATGMWTMLCGRGKDLEITLGDVYADAEGGRAHWEAKYTFSQTGRFVHNKIDAVFAFRDGKIIRHVDRFDFWKWSGQALGRFGTLLGWFGPVKALVRKKAARSLQEYMDKQEGKFPAPG